MNARFRTISLVAGVIVFGLASLNAEAAAIRVTCEKRAHRSVISVDANDLVPGQYRAKVKSGSLQSGVNRAISPLQHTVGVEIEFDFSSRPADQAAGATPIDAAFIKNGQVTGKILNAQGFVVISDTVSCRIR